MSPECQRPKTAYIAVDWSWSILFSIIYYIVRLTMKRQKQLLVYIQYIIVTGLKTRTMHPRINRLFAYCKGGNLDTHIWAWFGYFICYGREIRFYL